MYVFWLIDVHNVKNGNEWINNPFRRIAFHKALNDLIHSILGNIC